MHINDDLFYESGHIKTYYHDKQTIFYADMTASGLPSPIVDKYIAKYILPYYANTHSNSHNGRYMTEYIKKTREYIRNKFELTEEHKIIFTGNGTTGAINHLISVLNLEHHEHANIILSLYEHHSNFLPWHDLAERNTNIKITMLDHCTAQSKHCLNLKHMNQILENVNKDQNKCSMNIVSVTGCSNVTGIISPIDEIVDIVEKYNTKAGYKLFYLFVDLACLAPYRFISMTNIDACFISGHKYIGGTSTPGILIAKEELFKNSMPYAPGGGCVIKANNNIVKYEEDIEKKESGGTPNIIGIIRLMLSMKLLENNIEIINKREPKITHHVHNFMCMMKNKYDYFDGIYIGEYLENRLPIVCFYVKNVHYNIIVASMNDMFGIQVRGGISCCGTFGEYIKKTCGVLGWVRVTFHWSMSNKTIKYILKSIHFIVHNIHKIKSKYVFDDETKCYIHVS